MSNSNSSYASKTLTKLTERNEREVVPFVNLVTMNVELLNTNAQLNVEKEQLEFINAKLKEENEKMKSKSSEINYEQVSVLEKKLFSLQEELTELHRRRGEKAQQIIDQTAELKNYDTQVSELKEQIELNKVQAGEADKKIAKLKSIINELEGTNQLLKDEYQTLQLALNSAENKLLHVQKENDQLVLQIMEHKEKDVLRLNQENDKAMRLQQEKIRQQLAEAVAETKVTGADLQPFKFFRSSAASAHVGKESLDSAICHSVRIPTKSFLKFDAHEGEVNAIAWSPHGLTVGTGGTDRKIKIWDISKNICEQKGQLTGSNGAIMALDHDASGSLILGASSDFASRVWSIDDQRLRHTLTGHSNKVLAAKFFGDANKVVSASHDRTIKIWDLRSKACMATKFPGSSCNDIVCSDNNIISGHFDKKVRFWDIRSGTQPMQELELEGKITSLDLSRNGFWLLACCRDETLRLIDSRTYQLVRTFQTEGFSTSCDWHRATFSPDSEYVTVGSQSGRVYIWNINDHSKLETVLSEHTHPVIAVAWQPAGNSLTTCDKDKTVVVWAAI